MKDLWKQILLVFILAGFPLYLTVISHFNPKNKIENDPIILVEEEKPSFPIRLRIPSINVDAIIEYVGLTPEKRMDVPKGPASVAWFNLGPHPGEAGSAVIAGHSGWRGGISAAFDDLHKLKKGDKIYVEDEKGETVTFVVRELKTYAPNENAPEVFISNDGISHLNLITCTGFWNKILKSHSDRLVVFTDKE